MADTFHLDLVTPMQTVFSGAVQELVAPGTLGEFGVLPGHAAMLAELDVGRLVYRQGSEEKVLAAAGGFAEVTGEKVTVLLDRAARREELDAATLDEEIRELEAAAPEAGDPAHAEWAQGLKWKRLCRELAG